MHGAAGHNCGAGKPRGPVRRRGPAFSCRSTGEAAGRSSAATRAYRTCTGVTTPIEDRVQELTNRYYRGLEVLQALDEPMTVDELAAELELDTDEVRDRVAYLATFNRIRRDGDTVHPVE